MWGGGSSHQQHLRETTQGAARTDLDVSAAHVMLVTLQRQVPVLRVDEANQGLAVPSALSVETQRHAAPESTQKEFVAHGAKSHQDK